jgi:ParB/RepB/Spo0J family partition protein
MQTINLEVGRLNASKTNPRKTKGSEQSMNELVASIKAIGIIQPPTVRANGKGYDVLWGNRRVIAAKKAGLDRIQCVLVEMDDQAARVAATAENVVRIGMDPMDQFEAFYAIHKDGETPASIATIFGVKEHLVNQRLRLAELDPMVKKAYRDGSLDIDACMAMTLGTHKEQRALLKAKYTQEWSIKRELIRGKVPMSEALFDPKLYTGERIVDLFDNEDDTAGYATDRAQFHDLQLGAIDAIIKKEGKKWAFMVVSETTSYDLKKIGDDRVDRHYINEADTKTKEKKKYGVVFHLDPDSCRIDTTYGWMIIKPEKKKSKTTDKTGKTAKGGFTKSQEEILAQVHIDLHNKFATLNDAILFYLLAANRLSDKTKKTVRKLDTKALTELFINDVTGYASKHWPDSNIVKIAKSKRWNLRKVWTPDEAFIKPFSQEQLVNIAVACNVDLSGCPKKGQKVETLTKAFAAGEGKTKEWQP